MDPNQAFLALDAPHMGLRLALRNQPDLPFTVGTVIGAALNHRDELAGLADAVHAAPYQAPPQRPVLYLKPANTQCAHGSEIVLDPDVAEVAVTACLAIAIGAPVSRATPEQASAAMLGYTLAADLSVPHASFYRPAIRQKCRDGFCPLGPWIIPAGHDGVADDLELMLAINGREALRTRTGNLVRSAATLLADISQFMTFVPGDVLLVGASQGVSRAGRGDRIEISTASVGTLAFSLIDARPRPPQGDAT